MKGPLFYSKILLFGEYGIIQDSKGLSIPYNFYNGALKKDENPSGSAIKSNESLKKFVVYLEQLQAEQPELVTFNLEVLQQDVNSGMYFDSSNATMSECDTYENTAVRDIFMFTCSR